MRICNSIRGHLFFGGTCERCGWRERPEEMEKTVQAMTKRWSDLVEETAKKRGRPLGTAVARAALAGRFASAVSRAVTLDHQQMVSLVTDLMEAVSEAALAELKKRTAQNSVLQAVEVQKVQAVNHPPVVAPSWWDGFALNPVFGVVGRPVQHVQTGTAIPAKGLDSTTALPQCVNAAGGSAQAVNQANQAMAGSYVILENSGLTK